MSGSRVVNGWRAQLAQMSVRERRLLWVAVPVIFLLLLLLAGRQLQTSQQQAADRLERALEDGLWLQQQVALASGATECSGAPLVAGDLQRLALEYGLQLGRVEVMAQNQWRIELHRGAGNRVLDWLRQLACRGALATELDLQTLAAEGESGAEVNGHLRLISVM